MKLSNKLQKLFAMLLVAVMVISVLPMGSLSVFATVGEFAGGDGTEGNPYLIANKTQLNNVRYYFDASFKLIADIEFDDSDFEEGGDFYNDGAGFVPIGMKNYPFTGTFDGDGHVIKNLYVNIETDTTIYAGLIGYNKGTIKNLGMIDGNVSATSPNSHAYAGGIAGYNDYGTITNCYNTGNVSATSSSSYAYAGGIAGYNYCETTENCYNTGNVSATSSKSHAYAGGIAGKNYGTITNCYNTGDVSASSSPAYAGGIAGHSDGTITNCYNTGDVSVSSSSYYNAYAGGIVGNISSNKTITNCYNTGNVVAYSSSDAYAGGIAGYNSKTITNCYSTGNVAAYSDDYYAYAGGIAGYNYCETIENCYNTGNVSATSSSSYAYAGGIAGYNYCKTTENCYNTGNVSATSYSSYAYAGGIAGYNYYNNIYYGTITNCYNTGDVSAYASNAYAGGIVGFNDKTIENCYSIGDVAANVSSDDGTAYIGGIAGDSLDGTVTNCYYANNIAKGVGNGYDVTKKCTVEQLKNQDTFKNFDFETVWTMDNEVGYPYPVLKDVDMVEVLVYNIDGDYIFGVRAGTKVSALIDGINDCKIYNGENELGDDDLVGTGMVVKLIDGDTVKATYTLIVAGDINGDGKIDSVDYLLIKRSAFGTYTLTEAMNLAGDINGDGLIDSVDYLLIKRICFGTYKI